VVSEPWESSMHLLGSFDGTKEDPQGGPKDRGGRTHPRPGCSTPSHKGGKTKGVPKVEKKQVVCQV